jgi:DNA polymerase-3 subunit delta
LKLTLDKLDAHLAATLAPAYLVSGDEPLQVGEAVDAVRARARADGFTERAVFFIERGGGSSWDEIATAAQSLSLFAERRIVELRMPTGRPGAGAAPLLRLIEATGPDLLLIVITDRLERELQSAEWVNAVQERGAWLPIWPVERARLAQWLRERCARAGLKLDDEAVTLLAERTEGNLLAARQEIEKLVLLHPERRIGAQEVAASSGDSARFDVFQLGEAVQAGDAERVLRILDGLRAEGAEPVLVNWSLARELRGLEAMARGAPPPGRGWQRPSAAADQARRRAPRLPYARLTQRAARADRMAKGLTTGDAWDEMALLAVELCGLRTLHYLPND